MIDTISQEQLNHALAPHCTVYYYDRLTSTNQTAKEMAASGAPEGTLIIAEHQTGGRGRLGRSFFSPDQSGLYFSLILRPTLPPTETLRITTAAAVAVCKALEDCTDTQPKIKWVNDIFIDNKKVCGILSEATFGSTATGLDYAILGIGINLYPPTAGFPPEIADVAGTILDKPIAGLKTRLITAVLNRFWACYADLNAPNLRQEYESRMLLIGRTVTYQQNGVTASGKVLGIDPTFGLRLKQADGSITILTAGEVTIGSGNINTM